MLQHTRETSVNPLVASMTAPKFSASTVSGKEQSINPLLSLENSESPLEPSEEALDFSALLNASVEQSLQVDQALDKTQSIQTEVVSNVMRDAEHSLAESVPQPFVQSVPEEQGEASVLAIEQAIQGAFQASTQVKPPMVDGEVEVEEGGATELLTVESTIESTEQSDEAVQAPLTVDPQADIRAELSPQSSEQKMYTPKVAKSTYELERSVEKVNSEQQNEQQAEIAEGQALVQPFQNQAQPTSASRQVSQVATAAVMQGSAPRVSTGTQSHKTSQPSGEQKVDEELEEFLDASPLAKEVKANLQSSPMAQQMSSLQPGQQSIPPGMTAAMAKNQAFMEQFRQQQVVLKQQQAARAENMDVISSDFSASGSKSDGVNNLTGVLDKMASVPTSYQTIPHSIHSKKWGEALGKHLIMAASRDIQKMQITLNPEKLGPIQVRLHMDKDRQLHVNLLANHTLTREAMMEAMPRLRDMLESNGAQLANLDVADHGFEQESFTESNSEGSGKGAKGSGMEVSEEELQVIPTAKLSSASDSMVDYYA